MSGENIELFVRNSLILMWMEGAGLRRAEALSLKVADIPKWDKILTLELDSLNAEMKITGKGDKKRIVLAGFELLSQTREYIENERQSLVNRFLQKRGALYKDPEYIFLSTKTGEVLTADYLSQINAKAFKKAGVKGSGHRIRARFLTNLVTSLAEAQFERHGSLPETASILMTVAQLAGHENIETLRPYLGLAMKGLLRDTKAMQTAIASDKKVVQNRRTYIANKKLDEAKKFETLLNAIETGDKTSALKELRKLLTKYAK